MIKLKIQSAKTFTEILDLLINLFFFFFFTNYFIIFFHIYIKMSRDSSAEYYLDNKERL